MSAPPTPKGKPDDLAEVERALSILQGRHPDHERARRIDQTTRGERAAQNDLSARMASKAARSKAVRVAAVVGPVVIFGGFLGLLGRRELSRRANVTQVTTPFDAHGFALVAISAPSSTGSIEADVEPGCFLAVSTEPALLTISHAASRRNAAVGPVLFCTCEPSRIAITSDVPANGGVALLRANSASLGGSRAFSFLTFKPGSTLLTDASCREPSLDAWLDAQRAPEPASNATWFASAPAGPALAVAGFYRALKLDAAKPFAVVHVPKETCLVAMSSVATDRLGLRLRGGATPIDNAVGRIARCARTESTVLVTREGSGEVVILLAPSRRVGGMQGLREVARASLGGGLAATTIPLADSGWDAKQTLLASQIPEATVATSEAPDVPADKDARVVALSFETPNALIPEMAPETYSYCEPPLDAAMREAVCVFSGAQRWRTEAGPPRVGGLARAALPFWLFTMQSVNDPKALQRITQLFTLARRLGREGFLPTTLEALTELSNGVEVLGRTGEDAVVAVGVAPSDPWVYPLTDGPAWALGGAPRVVAVRPLETVRLTAKIASLPPKPSRRTVVFRRTPPAALTP